MKELKKFIPRWNGYRLVYMLFCIFGLLSFVAAKGVDTKVAPPDLNCLIINDVVWRKGFLDSVLQKKVAWPIQEIRELEVLIEAKDSTEKEISYRYKLHNFEADWNEPKYPVVKYTNLPGGQYVLEIISMEQGERSAPILLDIDVPKPIQEKWWFWPILTFCILLIPLTVIYFYYLDRSRSSLGLETVRNQIASDLHDDVGANLSAIKNFTELLERKVPSVANSPNLLQKIKAYLDETIERLQDTVWAINPLNDSTDLLFEKMQDFSRLMLSSRGIKLQYKNSCQSKDRVLLDMEQRHNLLLLFKEVVNNIVKHSKASLVNIDIERTADALVLQITDNGVGFHLDEEFSGNGLRNLKVRSRKNFIETNIQSVLNEGTSVRIVAYSM